MQFHNVYYMKNQEVPTIKGANSHKLKLLKIGNNIAIREPTHINKPACIRCNNTVDHVYNLTLYFLI